MTVVTVTEVTVTVVTVTGVTVTVVVVTVVTVTVTVVTCWQSHRQTEVSSLALQAGEGPGRS